MPVYASAVTLEHLGRYRAVTVPHDPTLNLAPCALPERNTTTVADVAVETFLLVHNALRTGVMLQHGGGMVAHLAERVQQRGMRATVGVPNVLRGSSKGAMVSTRELVGRGLADMLVADYHSPALLGAVFCIAELGLASLPAAARLAATNQAAAVGLVDWGAIEPGRHADLIAVRQYGTVPVVEATYVQGKRCYTSGDW